MENSVKRQLDLDGKNIVITGGAGFLGRTFASALAEMGGNPILFDLDQKVIQEAISELAAQGFKNVSGYVVDIADKKSCIDGVRQVLEKFKHIDVLINNAALTAKGFSDATMDFFAPFEGYRQDLWEAALKVNLTGTFLITQQVGAAMREAKRGSIINVASDVGVISPDQRIYQADPSEDYPGVPFNTPISYSTTKAALLNFTRHLATYWAPFNIRVNSFSPAGVYRNHDPKFVKKLSSRIPLGRMANAHEYKGPIVFLSSDASSFMTGSNLIVDGGRTCW